MKIYRSKLSSLLLSTVAGAIGVFAISNIAAADVRIAVATPITGPLAAPGSEIVNGAKQAAEDINAAGGISGEKISLSLFDDACEPKQAVSVANQIVGQGFNLVSGHLCSGSTIPASDVYKDYPITEITVSSNPLVTERGIGGLFRISGRDDQQGPAGAAYIVKNYPHAHIALLSDKSAYGAGLVSAAKKTLTEAGIRPVLDEGINAGEKDYSAIVAKLKSLDVTVVYFGGYHTEAGLIVRQAADIGLNLSLVGGDGLNTAELAAIAGKQAENVFFTFPPDPTKTAVGAKIAKELESKGVSTSGWTLYSYAIVQTFAEGMRRAGGKAADVPAALRSAPIETIIGSVSFDEKGDNRAPGYNIYHFVDGRPTEVAKP